MKISQKNVNMMLMLAVFAMALLMPEVGSAAAEISTVICNAVKFITTGVGAAIATVAIIVIGIGALMGKVSWGMAILVIIGIALIFGAAAIATALGAKGPGC